MESAKSGESSIVVLVLTIPYSLRNAQIDCISKGISNPLSLCKMAQTFMTLGGSNTLKVVLPTCLGPPRNTTLCPKSANTHFCKYLNEVKVIRPLHECFILYLILVMSKVRSKLKYCQFTEFRKFYPNNASTRKISLNST